MKFNVNKKYIYWGITAFCVLAAAILFQYGISKLYLLGTFFAFLIRILTPIIYGFVIAYLLTPVVNFIEKKIILKCIYRIKKDVKLNRQLKSTARMISVLVSIALTIFILYELLYMLIPELVNSISKMISSAPQYWKDTQGWIKRVLKDKPEIESAFLKYSDLGLTYLTTDLLPEIKDMLLHFSVGIWDFVVVLKNIAIGGIISVYILYGKERFAAGGKKTLYSILSCKKANLLLHNLRFVHDKVGGFIVGKIIDSLIIGIICFIVTSLMKMPYAVLISVIIGVTNIIPFFGPLIGAIPCSILILLVNPIQCVYFIIFVIILQTFDGNILGPRILSESTDLSSFWVIFSILVGGGMFGMIGMFIGVPMFAVIYAVICFFINHSLTGRNLSTDTEKYLNLKCIEVHESETDDTKSDSKYEFVYMIDNKEEKNEYKQIKFTGFFHSNKQNRTNKSNKRGSNTK